MSQLETRLPGYLAGITRQNIETLAAIQKQLLNVLNKGNHEWVAFLNKEAELASNLSKKMTTAKSISDATAAYQELISRQMELMTQQAKIIFENTVLYSQRRIRYFHLVRANKASSQDANKASSQDQAYRTRSFSDSIRKPLETT